MCLLPSTIIMDDLFSVLESILANEFVSKKLKKRLLAAGKRGSSSPGSCHLYKCHHHLLPNQPGSLPLTL